MLLNPFKVSLEKYLTPSLAGIIWISSTPLFQEPVDGPFYNLDYLMDGLLVKRFYQRKEQTENQLSENSDLENTPELFVSSYFQHSLYLTYIPFNEKTFERKLGSFIRLVPPLIEQPQEFLLINPRDKLKEASSLSLAFLKKEFPDFLSHEFSL